MFSVFSLKKDNPLTDRERMELHKLLEMYQNSPQGRWLAEIPWQIYKFYWSNSMCNTGVMGAFAPNKGHSIFLMPDGSNGVQWIETIISTVIHELRHAWQFATKPAQYVFSSLPLVREFTLERDAKKVQRQCEPFFEVIIQERAKKAYEARMRKYKKS